MPEGAIRRGHFLSFDFGQRRIGVAAGQAQTRTATALGTVAHGAAPDWDAIGKLVSEWRPVGFIVGLPLSADGDETPLSRQARDFGRGLANRFGAPVEYFDERLTSHAAQNRFAEARAAGRARRKDAARLDALAAKIILENWLQSRPKHE